MNYQELYVVCQIEDFSLKVMVNNYANNQIQVLYKEKIENEQFAENGVIINTVACADSLRNAIDRINKTLNIKVQRIALSLPSHNLKIYQSQAMMDFKNDSHIITNVDCSKMIDMTKNIIIDSNEIACLTKPYNFKVNNKNSSEQLPIGLKGQIMTVEALVYSLPKNLYNSQLEVLKNAQVDLLTVTIEEFALACNISNNNNIVLIDWNLNSTKISVFNNSVLYATTNIKIGWNQIIQELMKQMHCDYDKAKKYLQKIINLNSNYLYDIVVDKYVNQHNQEISLTKGDLQTIVQNQINEIITCIEYFLDEVSNNNSSEMEIIFTGITMGLAGITNYFKNHSKLANIKYMLNQNMGSCSYNWTTLIGITHYQHLVNIFSNNMISSVNTLPILPKSHHHRLPQNNETKKYNSPNLANYQYNGNSK